MLIKIQNMIILNQNTHHLNRLFSLRYTDNLWHLQNSSWSAPCRAGGLSQE